ncbi:hypothetical protein J6590_030481 [Homalodisca vitripennis]|nr:hypothetical protein J6590_030481 [Homalodisca vitripennis]
MLIGQFLYSLMKGQSPWSSLLQGRPGHDDAIYGLTPALAGRQRRPWAGERRAPAGQQGPNLATGCKVRLYICHMRKELHHLNGRFVGLANSSVPQIPFKDVSVKMRGSRAKTGSLFARVVKHTGSGSCIRTTSRRRLTDANRDSAGSLPTVRNRKWLINRCTRKASGNRDKEAYPTRSEPGALLRSTPV